MRCPSPAYLDALDVLDDVRVELYVVLVEVPAFALQEELQYRLLVVHLAQLAGDDGAPEGLLGQGAVAPPVQPLKVLVFLQFHAMILLNVDELKVFSNNMMGKILMIKI